MKLGKRQKSYGIVFVLLSLVLFLLGSRYPTSHAIRLASVDDRAHFCQSAASAGTHDCPTCNTPLLPQGYVDQPMGFPFTDYTSSLCTGTSVQGPAAFNGAASAVAGALIVGGVYVAQSKFRKAGARGR